MSDAEVAALARFLTLIDGVPRGLFFGSAPAVPTLVAELKKYPKVQEVVWCQDEPQNQGAWFFVQHNILENMSDGMKLAYAGRPASASPACGYAHLHQEQQKSLLNAAFANLKGYVITK